MDNLPYTNIAGDNFIWTKYAMAVPHNKVEEGLNKLHSINCLARTMWKEPLTTFSWLNPNNDRCPQTEKFVKSIIHIPSHHFLETKDLERIAKILQ